ncbi:class I adenylate-forming enzyme family protein [Natrialba sp. INN-245]|uniref:class I adenylate-forming enzyme family protein n=1 Tax=Natrialba sp. INN-245 TaxID=2690967 RepID=UPI00130FF4F9|nr:AMP-binding protein [Natrialba sp. INN-245]
MAGSLEWPTRDLLSHRASTSPDARAVVAVEGRDSDPRTEWTYAEFDRCVDRVVCDLEGAIAQSSESGSFEPEDRLGVLMDTRVAFAAVYFAAMRRGVAVVPLNVRETATELESKVARTDLDAIVCESATESLALEVADCSVVSVDESEREAVPSIRSALEADRGADAASRASGRGDGKVTPVPLECDRTHLIMFTSGTSGEPKGVCLTVGNLVASATASAFRLGVDPADRWLCCLPMYHMGGLAPVVRSVLYGTTVVIQRPFSPDTTARVIDEYGITGVSLVPTMCKRLLEDDWRPSDSLRFVLLGGAPATDDLLERCREAGVPVHPTYGMTETASQIATATPEETVEHEGTVGRPLVTTDVSIVDDEGTPVTAGEAGELVVSGPTVTPGYLESAHTEGAFSERGLHTGDVGYRDDGGRLWVLNRRSDRIVTGGENVDPGEVVDALRAHPSVDDAAVVGVEDEVWGERVSALVVPAAGTDEFDVHAVLDHCVDRLAGFKRPKTVAVVESLPRTPSGTVDRTAVRKRLLADGIDVTDRS